jgi:hypothetical protein
MFGSLEFALGVYEACNYTIRYFIALLYFLEHAAGVDISGLCSLSKRKREQ